MKNKTTDKHHQRFIYTEDVKTSIELNSDSFSKYLLIIELSYRLAFIVKRTKF